MRIVFPDGDTRPPAAVADIMAQLSQEERDTLSLYIAKLRFGPILKATPGPLPAEDDAELLQAMRDLLAKDGLSPNKAATVVAESPEGEAFKKRRSITRESLIRRLNREHAKAGKFNADSPSDKTPQK